MSSALLTEGYAARGEGRLADALALFLQGVGEARAASDDSLLASALRGLAQIESDLGHREDALLHYREAAAIYWTLGAPLQLAHALRHAGDMLRHLQRYREAEPLYREAVALYRVHPEAAPLGLANALRPYALLKDALGKPDEAVALWREARGLYAVVHVRAGVEECERQIALHGAALRTKGEADPPLREG